MNRKFAFRKNDVSAAPINSAYMNVKIKQEMEKYLEGSEAALQNFQKYLSSHKIPSLTVEVLNGKHTLRLRVDQRTTFGDLLKEVRLFWNVPNEKNFVLRDENGNYWSPLSNVIREFSALQHTPKLYFLSKAYPDKKVLEDFDPDALLKTAAEKFNRIAMVRNQGRARFLLVDSLKVIIFAAIFTAAVVLDHKVLQSYKYINAIQRTFTKPKSDRYFHIGDKNFHDISDLNGVLDYFKGSLRTGLFEQYPMGLSNISSRGNYDNNYFVYGGIRLRQLRVYMDSCSLIKATGISSIIPACYADMSEESKYPGVQKLTGDSWGDPSCSGGANNTLFGLDSYLDASTPVAEDANEAERFPKVVSVPGQYHHYTGEGFYQSIPLEKGAYDEAIKKISDCRWIDERTRVVFVEINFYNPNTDQFAAMKLMFEVLPTGVVHPSVKIHANRLTMYTRDDDLATFILQCCVLIFCLTRFFAWKSEISALVGQYGTWTKFLNIFTYLDICVVFLQLYNAIMRLSLYFRYEPFFLLRQIETKEYYEIYGILSQFHQIMVLDSIAVLFSYFSLLKYLDTISEGLLILETFNMAVPLVLSYMVVYSSVLFGFVILYHNIYGPSIEVFSDFSGSLRALLLTLIGDVQYTEAFFLPWETSALHDIIFWSF